MTNAHEYLRRMNTWNYFNRPCNMAFHDLTTNLKPPANLRSLLGLNLKFIPIPRRNTPWEYYNETSLPKFERSLRLKAHFSTRHRGTDLNDDEEPPAGYIDPDSTYQKRMYIATGWNPPPQCPFPPPLVKRLQIFKQELYKKVTLKKCKSNLLPHQERALESLRNQDDFVIMNCDKNLGPAIIERTEYIRLVFRDHLSDQRTYQRLQGEENIKTVEKTIMMKFDQWHKKALKANTFTATEKRYFQHHREHFSHPFSTFYATAKVHKTRLSTRPIVSTSGTLLYAVGVWCDEKLQIAAQKQRSYFKNTFDLKKDLDNVVLPPNAYLFTSDAVSMYTNIPTTLALQKIGEYLRKEKFPGIPVDDLMRALRLIMKYNVFQFGDTFWKQKTGTAMGTPPAPPWATLFFAIFEDVFLDTFSDCLLMYRRFIDDVFGIFVHDPTRPERYDELRKAMNECGSRLQWEMEPPSKSVAFMDLVITIRGSHIETTLYEKEHHLHLYIPPHSYHPPGLLPGMVHGMIFRINTLCSEQSDKNKKTLNFFFQLQRRGWSPSTLRPIFKKAIRRAISYTGPKTAYAKNKQSKRSVLFHLRYHPQNPSSSMLQHLWNKHICNPPWPKKPLWIHRNYRFKKIEVDRMVVCYNRPLNLGNLLSYRVLKDSTTGPPASSFCD